jgi:hypothetical protein
LNVGRLRRRSLERGEARLRLHDFGHVTIGGGPNLQELLE